MIKGDLRDMKQTCRVKLHELHVLIGQTGTTYHGCAVTRTRVRRRAREVGATVATAVSTIHHEFDSNSLSASVQFKHNYMYTFCQVR